ncbi:HEPN domain-containing protein [Citromicrobium bathyomarinum]
MLPLEIIRNQQRIDSVVNEIDAAIVDVSPSLQGVLSSHLVILASGHVELSVKELIKRYGDAHGNRQIVRFMDKTIDRENSLNCEKIENILSRLDRGWWPRLSSSIEPDEISAIDSLKALRDQVAHGRFNGTGFMTVRNYYHGAKKFVTKLDEIVA